MPDSCISSSLKRHVCDHPAELPTNHVIIISASYLNHSNNASYPIIHAMDCPESFWTQATMPTAPVVNQVRRHVLATLALAVRPPERVLMAFVRSVLREALQLRTPWAPAWWQLHIRWENFPKGRGPSAGR